MAVPRAEHCMNHPIRLLRCLPERTSYFAFALALLAGTALSQPIYKIVTPDGTVIYTDKPLAAGQTGVRTLNEPQLGSQPAGIPPAPAAAPMPAPPRAGIATPLV